MDKKKVAELARVCSLSCKKLVKDNQLMRKLSSPTILYVSLVVTTLITKDPYSYKGTWLD